MNKEVKAIVEYLEENREQIYGLSYYPDDVLTSRELIMLMDYIKQLETNIDEAIELLSKGVTFCENDSQGLYDKCNIVINRENKIVEILKKR